MTRHHGFCEVDELPVGSARFITEHEERGLLVDGVSFHEDALGTPGERSSTERTFQVVELGEPSQDDIDRASG